MTRYARRGLLAAALFLACPAVCLAHDPGLSSLTVRVTAGQIAADLTLAASDVDPTRDVRAFAERVLTLAIDGRELAGVIDDIAVRSATGIRVQWTYERSPGNRLTIRSSVPQLLTRGHREFLSVQADDGATLAERMLDASHPDFTIDLTSAVSARQSPAAFFTLGVTHILGGYDHLLFLAALFLAIRDRRDVLKIITAFTVAHSLTLAATVMGLIRIPPRVVEPLIAASIVYVGVENVLRRQPRSRWKVTFLFGLIHGCGFAGALQDLGVGGASGALAMPLASFNVGVEAGQIAVAMLIVPILWRLSLHTSLNARLTPACSLLVTVAGGYWLIERI